MLGPLSNEKDSSYSGVILLFLSIFRVLTRNSLAIAGIFLLDIMD